MRTTRLVVLMLVGCGNTGDTAAPVDGAIAQTCGDAGLCSPTGANRSGTRIRLRYLETPDGARVVTGVRDAQRDEDCAFQLAADGATRCLPAATELGAFYADAGCSQPVAIVSDCYDAPKYLSGPGSVSCNTTIQRKKICLAGAKLASAYRFNDFNGTCASTGASNGTGYYPIDTEVPATDFAMATASVEP